MNLAQFVVLMIAWTVVMISTAAMVTGAWNYEQGGAVSAVVIGLLASMEV